MTDFLCLGKKAAGLAGAALLSLTTGCGLAGENASHVADSRSADHATATSASFKLLLRPVRDDGGGVAAIEVRSEINAALLPDSGRLTLSAPIVYAGVYGIADRIRDLTAADAAGEIELIAEDDPPASGGFPYFRHWRAARDVTFPVTIAYRSAVEPEGARSGPPFGIRPAAGGVSGAGSGFLVLPENTTSNYSEVEWDLGGLEDNSEGITSFGEGSFGLEGPPRRLMQGWYMAGPIERHPETGDAGGFSAAWLGDFPFDERSEMKWAANAYAYLGRFFEYLDPPPRYRVFMRLMETPPYGGGTALMDSFMLSRGPARPGENDGEGPRSTFFHEMIHLWVGGVEGPQGVTSWFSEGLTTYYTALLPMHGGFGSVAEYGDAINEIAKSYYASPARNWSAERIVEVGFADGDVRHVPYWRGALYFADLDSQIRAASGGRRTLHDFIREIFYAREREEYAFDHAKWIELVTKETGREAAEEFKSVILEGETIAPAADAFGPCFERRSAAFDTADGKADGFEWVRVAGISDEICRAY